jgi:hypothetical protein
VIRYLLLLIITISSLGASEKPLLLKGILLDSLFRYDTSLSAELLETGETFTVVYGEPFSIGLTDDATWNLCIRSDSLEQCYTIIRRDSTDSIITDSLGNDNKLEVFSSFIEKKHSPKSVTDRMRTDTAQQNTPVGEAVSEIVTQLRPVVIQVRKRPRRRIGQSTVSSKAIERQPGLAEADVIKAIQALPGVVASSDFSSKIYVRGGGSDQNLFLFDNGVVYSPIHFFGLFSTFLVDGVESVDFYKGGFSPEYGNRLSSVVDIKSRKGGKENNDTLQLCGSAQITTFASTLSLEASKGKLRLNMSGRATYIKEALAFLRKIGATDVDIDYRFHDLQGNIAWRINENQYVTISGYTGQDKLIFDPLETFWGNRVIPVNYYWSISDELSFSAALSYSYFDQEFTIQGLQTMTNYIRSVSFKPRCIYTGFERHSITAGVESQHFEILFGSEMDFIDFSYEEKKKFMLHSLLLEDKYTIGKLDIAAGLRNNYFTELKSFSAEPRLSLSWSFSSDQRIEAHTGYYRQFINSLIFGDMESLNETYYSAGKEPTRTNRPASSILFSVGFTQEDLFDQYDFIWEAYYKTLDDLFIFDPNAVPDSIRNDLNSKIGDFFVTGEGYSLGTEVSLRKKSGIFSGGLSYAFGFSVQKEGDRVYRAKWEIPHSFKLDGAVTWRDPKEPCIRRTKKQYLRSSLQIKYTSGLPYTEITGHLPTHYLQQGGVIPRGGPEPSLFFNTATPLGGRNKSRYPSYGRVDLKLIDWGRDRSWNFSWTLLNILDRENVFIYLYDTGEQPPERITIPQFPFFPILFSFKRYF